MWQTTWSGWCVNPGVAYQVWQHYTTCGPIRSNIDSAILMQSTWSPYDPGNWQLPFRVAVSGETLRWVESDVPGSAGSPVNWSQAAVQLAFHSRVGVVV